MFVWADVCENIVSDRFDNSNSSASRKWDDDVVQEACDLLGKELSLPPGVPGGMETYRNTLCVSFFFKFYLTVQMKRNAGSNLVN